MPLPISRATYHAIPAVLRPGHKPAATAAAAAATNTPASGPRYGMPPALGMMPRRHKRDSEPMGAASLRPRQPLPTLLGTVPIKSNNMGPMQQHALPQYAQTPLRPPLPPMFGPGSGYGMATQPQQSWGSHMPSHAPAAPPPMFAHARPQPYPYPQAMAQAQAPMSRPVIHGAAPASALANQASERPSQYLRPGYLSASPHGMPDADPTRRPTGLNGMAQVQAPMSRPVTHGAAPASALANQASERPSQYLRPGYPSASPHGMPASPPTHRPTGPTGMERVQAPMNRPGIHGAAPASASAKTAGTAPAAAKSKWDGRPVLVNDESWFRLSHRFHTDMQRLGQTSGNTARLRAAKNVLSDHMTGDQRHVYMLDGGKPMGVMTSDLLTDGSVHVNGIVTHPGSKGVGGALIEGAVNTSVENGGSGIVHLQYLDQASREAYSKLGFRFEGGSGVNMILVPAARPDLWERSEEGYRLKKPAPKMT